MDFVDEYYADKDLSLLKKLTLIIPTYNRNYYLSRCLWYHAHFPFGQIIVADSSPEEKKVVNRKTVEKVIDKFGANILYLEYEDIDTKYGEHIYPKWLDAANHAKTEFTHYCADKDFVIPTTIVDDVLYLEKNGDYSLSSGGYEKITDIESTPLKAIYFSRLYTYLQSCCDDSPCNRLSNSLIPHYKVYIYSTYRTSALHVLSDLSNQYSVFDVRYGELMYTVIPILYGKYRYSSNNIGHIRDFIIRSNSIKGPTKESSASRYPSIFDYKRDPSLEYLYTNFKKCMTNTICKLCDMKIDEAELFFDINIRKSIFENRENNKKIVSSLFSKMGDRSSLRKLWRSTPKKIRKLANFFTSKLLHQNISTGNYSDPAGYAVYSSDKSPEGVICNLIVTTLHLYDDDYPMDIVDFCQ